MKSMIEASRSEPRFLRRDSLNQFQCFESDSMRSRRMSIAHYRYDGAAGGITQENAQEATFMVVIPLRISPPHHVFRAGRPIGIDYHSVSSLAIFDLQDVWRAEICPSITHETFNVFIPVNALIEITDSFGCARTERLSTGTELTVVDETMLHLVRSMLPALSVQGNPSRLFLDHMLLAMCVHLAATYGGVDFSRTKPTGGLAPWQERRAKDLLTHDLSSDLSMSKLASDCGVSVSHFQRAFRRSTGETPHQWRMKRRVERARLLIESRSLALPEIALICGFSDQSHLGRAFVKIYGFSPGAYRTRLSERD